MKYVIPVDEREKEGRLQIRDYDGWCARVILEPEDTEDSDIEKLLNIEI